MEKTKVLITWNGQGGKLDSTTITHSADDDYALQKALVKMLSGNIVTPGDSFTVDALE